MRGGDGEVDVIVDGGHGGSEGAALLKLGLLEADDEGWAERLRGADDEGEAPGSYTHLRAHETVLELESRRLREKENKM